VAPFFEPFFEFGGVWVVLLAVLTWIAYTRLSSIKDEAGRWAAALSEPWLMKVAVILALLCWVWNFGRLFTGGAYLPGAGTFAELSTVLLVLILILAGVAWLGIRSWSRFRPWLTHGLVLLLIAAAGLLLRDAPEGALSQDSGEGERRAVIFVQGRLAHLGCFKAVGEPDRRDGSFEALTAIAVSAFQQANELNQDPKLDTPGVIRPDVELPLLTKPFPVLFGPKPCPS
jgi:Putative peptidoglycan binding domain